MKKAVFWDVAPCRLSINQRSGAICSRWFLARGFFFLFSSTLKMEAIRSFETSVCAMSTQRHIPEDGILHNHSRENLKSYIIKVDFGRVLCYYLLYLRVLLFS
jgi:hypothetical protein